MAVAMFLDLPGTTTEQYDQLNERMGTTRPEDEPEGLIFHVCAQTTDGLLICDVWRSQEEVDDFLANRLGPAAVPWDCRKVTRRVSVRCITRWASARRGAPSHRPDGYGPPELA